MELSESISALSGGIVLQKDLPSGILLDPGSPQYQDMVRENPEVIGEYSGSLLKIILLSFMST